MSPPCSWQVDWCSSGLRPTCTLGGICPGTGGLPVSLPPCCLASPVARMASTPSRSLSGHRQTSTSSSTTRSPQPAVHCTASVRQRTSAVRSRARVPPRTHCCGAVCSTCVVHGSPGCRHMSSGYRLSPSPGRVLPLCRRPVRVPRLLLLPARPRWLRRMCVRCCGSGCVHGRGTRRLALLPRRHAGCICAVPLQWRARLPIGRCTTARLLHRPRHTMLLCGHAWWWCLLPPPALCSLWAVLRRLPRPLSCLPLPPLLLPPPASFLPSSLLSLRRRRWVLQMNAAVRCTDVSPARTFSNLFPVRPRSLLPRATTAVHALMRHLPLLPGGWRESRRCWSRLGCWESRPRRWRGRIFGARPRPLAARSLLGSLRARRRITLRRWWSGALSGGCAGRCRRLRMLRRRRLPLGSTTCWLRIPQCLVSVLMPL